MYKQETMKLMISMEKATQQILVKLPRRVPDLHLAVKQTSMILTTNKIQSLRRRTSNGGKADPDGD